MCRYSTPDCEIRVGGRIFTTAVPGGLWYLASNESASGTSRVIVFPESAAIWRVVVVVVPPAGGAAWPVVVVPAAVTCTGDEVPTRVAAGFAGADALDDRFDGSLGAIRHVLETREPLVASDARADAVLGRRPSVVELGIGALACVPLVADGSLLGLIYVDGRRNGGRSANRARFHQASRHGGRLAFRSEQGGLEVPLEAKCAQVVVRAAVDG